MTKQTELAKNTFILTFGKICTQFVSFLLLPLYTALLVPEEFGIVDLFNTYVTLLVPIFNWQFENGLFRFMLDFRNNIKQQKRLFSTVFIANLVQISIYFIFYLFFEKFIHSDYKIFLALDVAGNILLNTLLQFPRGLGKNITYSIASFISAVSTVLLNVLFIAGFNMGAYGMFLATFLSKIITIIYLVVVTKVWNYFSFKNIDLSIFKKIAKYSLPLVPNNLSWWVITSSNRTIISHALSITANGIYSVANKFSAFYITFYNIFNLSWTESVSLHFNDDDGKEFLEDTINTIFKIFSCIALGIIAIMPFIFPIMVNQRYVDAYYQIPIQMMAVLFQVVVGLYSAIYVALKKSVEIAKTSFGAAIINIVVNIALINFIGLYSASIAILLAYAMMAIYRYFDLKKYVNVKLKINIILSLIIMICITVISYYYNHLVTNIIVLICVLIYSIVINKSFLQSIFDLISKKMKNYKLV